MTTRVCTADVVTVRQVEPTEADGPEAVVDSVINVVVASGDSPLEERSTAIAASEAYGGRIV